MIFITGELGHPIMVTIDEALVAETTSALAAARETATRGKIPPPLVDSPKCPRCSLVTICLPDETAFVAGADDEREADRQLGLFDRELVTRKLVLITRDLDRLLPIAAKDLASFLGSDIDQAVAERLLERMIGRMIDVNYHLLTESGEAPPSDYHASFLRLAEIKILDPKFATRIARYAGLRNRLVHVYEEIDPQKMFEAVQSAREDIVAHLRAVQEHLQGLGPPEPRGDSGR